MKTNSLPIKITPPRIILLGYLIVILGGTVLLSLPIATQNSGSAGIIEALFTSASAVCVTGLIVVNTATYWTTFGQVIILILIQIGGLGFMTFSTLGFILLGKNITFSSRILIKEDIGNLNYSGLVQLAKYVIGLALGVEFIGGLLLFLNLNRQMDNLRAAWFSIFHSISAFCNAGFDLFGNSLESFTTDIGINLIIAFLIIIGGLGFTVTKELWNKFNNDQSIIILSLHSKVVIYITIFLLLLGTGVVFIFEFNNPQTMGGLELSNKLVASFFLSVTPRTAGFNTVPTGALRINTIFFIIILMFIGASPCSTGGGIKTTTFGAILTNVSSALLEDDDYTLLERRLGNKIVDKAIAIVVISLALIIFATLILTSIEDAKFIKILFEVVSAFGTVGLSTGITGDLSQLSRLVIIVMMVAGRVGPLTLLISLGEINSRVRYYRYPEEDIMLG
ncbi:TrkH family potassium uptake protein [Halanaerobaculum tunisiense]